MLLSVKDTNNNDTSYVFVRGSRVIDYLSGLVAVSIAVFHPLCRCFFRRVPNVHSENKPDGAIRRVSPAEIVVFGGFSLLLTDGWTDGRTDGQTLS